MNSLKISKKKIYLLLYELDFLLNTCLMILVILELKAKGSHLKIINNRIFCVF